MTPLDLNCQAYAAMLAGNRALAIEKYEAVLEADPDNVDALRFLGEILGQSGEPHRGIVHLRKAHALDNRLWSTWCDYGQALQTTAQTNAEMVNGVGHTLCGTRIAEDEMRQIYGPDQQFHPGHYNTALGLLALGEWREGFRLYEHGYLCKKRHIRTLKGKLWKGEDIAGKRLFVYWEGGYGDTLCWTRFLPLLKAQTGADIILEVQRDLQGLYKNSGGAHAVCKLITKPNLEDLEDLPDFDYRISLLSLAYRLGLDRDDVPNSPYILPNVAPWPIRGKHLNVGVCWKGNPLHENDRNRSMDEKTIMGAFRGVPFVQVYSLQYNSKPDEAIPLPMKTYLDTAAMIRAMDLVVTVDTSVAHLAAAMGKPTWILLPYIACDWRWGLEDEHTLLYPSAQLYRQKAVGDWQEVIGRVREDIETMVDVPSTPERELVTA